MFIQSWLEGKYGEILFYGFKHLTEKEINKVMWDIFLSVCHRVRTKRFLLRFKSAHKAGV